MDSHPNLPDGFISILEAQTRRGQALYGTRWPEIEKASNSQVASGGMTAFAAQIGADGETIQSLGERVAEAAGQSWKYRTPAVTVLRDWLLLGTLKGYLFRPGQIPKLQPNDVWNDPKLQDGLLAGYVYEGNPKQQRKAYIIVKEDELAKALEADQTGAPTKRVETRDEPAKVAPPSGGLEPTSQSSKAALRRKLKAWLESFAKSNNVLTKPQCLEVAQAKVSAAVTMTMLRQVWLDAKLPKEWKDPGRRAGT